MTTARPELTVRRLAALDLHGARGTASRRRLVTAEYALGVICMSVFGAWLLTSAGVGGRAVGAYLVGVGINYAPLVGHAFGLRGPGILDAELTGVDIRAELRRYGVAQLVILVPLAVVVFELRDRLRRSWAQGPDASE